MGRRSQCSWYKSIALSPENTHGDHVSRGKWQTFIPPVDLGKLPGFSGSLLLILLFPWLVAFSSWTAEVCWCRAAKSILQGVPLLLWWFLLWCFLPKHMSFARVPICTRALQFQKAQPTAGLCVPLLSAPSLTPAQPSPGHKEVQGLNRILFSFGPDWIWVSSITKLMEISTCHLSPKGSKTVSP